MSMKRNEDSIWYDKGYSDGVQNTIKDRIIPKILGVGCLSALLVFDQYWILTFVVIWAAFSLNEWYGKQKYHEANPPSAWESDE